MWRLSRLTINGFKSFADRAELVFPEGITAVVGPNGCGKSNISDAIVWALGEQSTSALRAQQMRDVIFQGSSGRKPKGAAEVTLHLTVRDKVEDPADQLVLGVAEDGGEIRVAIEGAEVDLGDSTPATADGDAVAVEPQGPATGIAVADYPEDELSVTRRLLRSGDSEYLLNGKKCLLRDIRERLLGTGLGFRTCFTIGQGKIDQILSAAPMERRQPIEEAAGISLYRRRRHSTNLKLEATAQDLARVQDICDEVARQMRSLKRQAGRAKKYRALRDQLRTTEYIWFGHRLREVESARDVVKAEQQAAAMGEEVARERMEFATREWEQARRAWREQRQLQTRRRQELYNAQVQQERAKAESTRQRDRAAFAIQRLEDAERKIVEIREQRAGDAEIVDARRRASAEADQAAHAAERMHQETAERLDPVTHFEPAPVPESERETTLEIHSLAASVEVADQYRGAVALVLGRRLTLPLLDDEQVGPWLDYVADRRGVTGGLRHPGVAVTTELPAGVDAVPLLDYVKGANDVAQAVLSDLLSGIWLVTDADAVMQYSADYPGHGFVDASGSAWARGAEFRRRQGTTDVDAISEGRRATRLRMKQTEDAAPEAVGPPPEEVEAARIQVEQAATALRSARAQAAAAAREYQVSEAGLKRLDSEIRRLDEECEALRRTKLDADTRAGNADVEAESSAKRTTELEGALANEETEASADEEGQLGGLEAAVSAGRRETERAQSRRAGSEVRAAEVRVERNHLQQQVRERLDKEPHKLLRELAETEAAQAEAGESTPAPNLHELDRTIRDVRNQIDRLGPVNLVAYDDYETQKDRFEDLDGQRRDLVQAADNLRAAIRKIDGDCVQRFADAFDAIDGYFNRIFRQLFGGGRAGMRLENPEDPLNSGIEIMAQPPGKTLQSIRLMSGGERSLIALALMFAIFEYHPAPFCILDEADAALDERNVGRFVQALHHFQERAQFIMITHNKRSMEVADLLYGVTMAETGVSKLVSVSLN
ncbi:MAG: AAA family ATPase [Acidobacteria bacterium]|nr:AAA family ATPase [Acidobacteriota bacterium]